MAVSLLEGVVSDDLAESRRGPHMGLVPESLSSLRSLARHLRWIALTERLVRIGDGKAVNAHG